MIIAKTGYTIPLKHRISIEFVTFAREFWKNDAAPVLKQPWSTPLCKLYPDYERNEHTVRYFFFSDAPALALGRTLYPSPFLGMDRKIFVATGKYLHWNALGIERLNLLEFDFTQLCPGNPEHAYTPVWFFDESKPGGCQVLNDKGALET